MAVVSEEILEAIKKAAVNGKLTCSQAQNLALELQVSPRTIREAADLLHIKISDCQLGCF